MKLFFTAFISLLICASCLNSPEKQAESISSDVQETQPSKLSSTEKVQKVASAATEEKKELEVWEKGRSIHVFVALCDNKNQGIVPVPASIGNGQKPFTNLYWGAGYGIKTFFDKKSKDWQLIKTIQNPTTGILERIIFKHSREEVYLLADAWDGAYIKQTTVEFLKACSGDNSVFVEVAGKRLPFGGKADLLCYIGHDGLMEFDLRESFSPQDAQTREAIILACISKSYFGPYLKQTGAEPLLWTTGLMAPEAYTLEWALDEWVAGKSPAEVRQRAAEAYNHYQKCGVNGAKRLLVSGW